MQRNQKITITRIIKLIAAGKTYEEIKEQIAEETGFKKHSVENIITKAKQEIDKRLEKYAEKAAEKNYLRLESIIEQAMENDDDKITIQAIDLENKMLNIYNQKITLQNNDNEPFKITFEK